MCPGASRVHFAAVALSEMVPQVREERVLRIHNDISECRVCGTTSSWFKETRLAGSGLTSGRVMIVGQGPGRSELQDLSRVRGTVRSHAGAVAGNVGANAASPRAGIYFTSVIKCVCPSARHFPLMARNCRAFLQRQITERRPELVITLGRRSLLRGATGVR